MSSTDVGLSDPQRSTRVDSIVFCVCGGRSAEKQHEERGDAENRRESEPEIMRSRLAMPQHEQPGIRDAAQAGTGCEGKGDDVQTSNKAKGDGAAPLSWIAEPK